MAQHQDQNPEDYPPTGADISQGKIVGEQGILVEFTNIVNELTTKKCESISYIDVPTKLLHQG